MLERLTSNWPFKLLALFLAFGVWISVTGESDVLQDFDVPLDVQLPQSRLLTTPAPNTVTVRLRGSESRMRRLDAAAMELHVDLLETSLGQQDILLSKSDLVGVPAGVEIDFIFPDRLRVVVDLRAQRELPVEPTFLGQPPEGYAFYGVRVSPEAVVVEGPEAEVAPLDHIDTNAIRLDKRRQPFTIRVNPVPVAEHVRIVDPQPLEIRVEVDKAPVERQFAELPLELSGPYASMLAEPAQITLTLSGPPDLLSAISREQLRLTLDTRAWNPEEPSPLAPRLDFIDVPLEDLPRLSAKAFAPNAVELRAAEEQP